MQADLVVLHLAHWGGQRVHREASTRLRAQTGCESAKALVGLGTSPSLTSLLQVHASLRTKHYYLSLASGTGNVRVLPRCNWQKHVDAVAAARLEHDKYLHTFISGGEYAALVSSAPARMGSLYKANLFPQPSELPARFRCDAQYLPPPETGPWVDFMNDAAKEATEDVKLRVGEALQRVVDTLSAPDKIFRDSLFENLSEIATELPGLNINGDRLLSSIEPPLRAVASTVPDEVRKSQAARNAVADHAKEILERLGL